MMNNIEQMNLALIESSNCVTSKQRFAMRLDISRRATA
jgi:hypothetical protein